MQETRKTAIYQVKDLSLIEEGNAGLKKKIAKSNILQMKYTSEEKLPYIPAC